MSNHSYMISEYSFYKRREDKATLKFAKEAGIEMEKIEKYKLPTMNSIKSSLSKFGLKFTSNRVGKNRYELEVSNPINRKFWIEYTSLDKDFEIEMIKIGGSSDQHLLIDFFRFLRKEHGNFLYYCDSGLMSLINSEKDNNQVLKEMQIYEI